MIKRMTGEHINELALIEKQIFGIQNAEKTLSKELENKISAYFIAEESGKISGYAGIWNICGEGDIINIAVLPEYRRSGIASRLLETLFEFCRENDISALNLEVRESNTPARSLYKKHGFAEVGERKRYYDGTETAVLMRKDF